MIDTNSPKTAQWFGHPRGLSTLFFTELWERFSYYGMRALLVLFMTSAATEGNPGLDFGEGKAGAIYGLYTFFVYVLALPGGWIADNIWGQRKSVFIGGCIIALGHFTMAGPLIGLPDQASFFLGLLLIAIGTGLLKPNVSTMVGDLYPEGGARRDAGFSIFYMGINLGAFIGPLLAGWLGETYNWHYGFSVAGFGMVLGVIQYRLGARHLGDAGLLPSDLSKDVLKKKTLVTYVVLIASFILATIAGTILLQRISLEALAQRLGVSIIIIAVLFFAYLLIFTNHTKIEKKRLVVIFWLFILSALFWSGFEQAGSSLNIFARESTDRVIGGWELPASWLQSVNATFIIILAPVFGSLWITLARLNRNPSIPIKFSIGLLGLAGGFFVIAWGAANSGEGSLVSPVWLVVMYFFHTVGELSLSPVGLSSITKLAPAGRVGQMMGVWFIGTALGNLFAGLVAGQLETLAAADLFRNVAMTIGIGGIVALFAAPLIKRLMGKIE